jgi:surface antigen Omp85-like protein
MRIVTLLLLLASLAVPCAVARAQEPEPAEGTRIESAEVSGFSIDQLSPGLQRDIESLKGERFQRDRIDRLVQRIEEEHPEVVAAVRTVSRPDDQVRVIFLVARISDDGDLVANINARYPVESVEIRGIPETDISQALRDRLQRLIGGKLDNDEADDLINRLTGERPGYDVSRRIERGTRPGQIRVVFEFSEAERLRWMPFVRSRSRYVYHSDQGWSGVHDIPMGGRFNRATVGFAFSNSDDLIEEYSGVRVRFESRRIGTERLGASLEVSRFNNTWREPTQLALAANPAISEPYRTRLTVEPIVTVALTRQLRVSGGVSLSNLVSLSHSPDSQMANAVVGGIFYTQRWDFDSLSHQNVDAGYEIRSSALDSDLTYRRHFGHASYRYDHDHNTVLASVFLGRITGSAPLFERFSLGDTSTLRGWNKFDIAPGGGDHVFHQSLEYRFYNVALFLDTGSIWDAGTDKRLRTSTGFGFHADNFFATLAFPLNEGGADATFMMGVRF